MDRRAGSLLALMGLAVAASCLGPEEDTASGSEALVGAAAVAVLQDELSAFSDEMATATASLEAWAAAPEDELALEQARTDFTVAWARWQRIEPMQLGPAASSLSSPDGLDLRDEIYSWPTVNPCRVDQETVEAEWNDAGFFTANLVNAYGMDALEQVLWGPEEDACAAQVGIDEAWDALGTEGVRANRAAFSVALANGVTARVAELRSALEGREPEDGPEAVLHALFYLETVTKDRKLAWPLGLVGCGTSLCPEDVEAPTSGLSVVAVEANLDGFDLLFHGGDGVGLDDLLLERGREDLLTDLELRLDEATATAQGLSQPLDELLLEDPSQVEALHADVKAVTDLLKGEIATVLSLELPDEAAGDAD